MSRPTAAVINRYREKAYDRYEIQIPKGMLDRIKARAESKSLSTNAYICGLIRADMGLGPEGWRRVVTPQDSEPVMPSEPQEAPTD